MTMPSTIRRSVCRLGSAATLFVLATIGATTPSFAGAEPFLGEIEIFGFNFCPLGWAALNGQLFQISQNTALFALLGTTYGGDGITTFALPKARPILTATGVALTQCIAMQGIFPSRD